MWISLRGRARSRSSEVTESVTTTAARLGVPVKALNVILGVRLIKVIKRVVGASGIQENYIVKSA